MTSVLHILFIVFSLFVSSNSYAAPASDVEFSEALQQLTQRNLSKKQVAIESLQLLEHAKMEIVLNALLDSRLYYIKSSKKVVLVKKLDQGFEAFDILDGSSLGVQGKRKVKKIGINNKIRKSLRVGLALLNLKNPDAQQRLMAVQDMMNSMDDVSADILRKLVDGESDEDVNRAMQTAIALSDIKSDDKKRKLAAVNALQYSVSPETKNALLNVVKKDEDGKYIETDAAIVTAAIQALDKINTRIKFYGFTETLFFGLSLGSVLLLSAIGLAITFGVMGVINMAHGELMMLGAYTTYVIQLMMPNNIETSLFVAIPAAFLVAGLMGILIERGVLRYLYGRPLETLLATFGLSLVLQQMVRTIFSPLNRAVETPEWMSGAWQINEALSLTYNRLYIIIFSLIVFAILLMILKKTSLGLQIRAVSQNRSMAKAMGVRSEWVDALTFGLGSGIAGVAGVALSQLTNVGPNLGQAYIIDSFMVVVFGGVGNLWGTLVGAMSLGVVNKFLEPWSGAVLAKILVLVAIILFIQKRPRGLFPQKGRAAEN